MGLADPYMLRHTAYLGCWTSLLTNEGAARWKRSFPGLADMCTDLVLGDGQGGRAHGAPTALGDLDKTGDLLAELRACQHLVASPSCRQKLPCPLGVPPVVGAKAHAAHGKVPRAGGNDNQGHNSPSISMVSKLIAAWHVESPISFQDLENTDGPRARGTKAGRTARALDALTTAHLEANKKSLPDNTSNIPEPRDEKVVLPLVGPTRRSSRAVPQTRLRGHDLRRSGW
jgi:hypothetical protein